MTVSSHDDAQVLLYRYQKDTKRTYAYLTELYREKIITPKMMKLESETNLLAKNCKYLEKRLKNLEDKING